MSSPDSTKEVSSESEEYTLLSLPMMSIGGKDSAVTVAMEGREVATVAAACKGIRDAAGLGTSTVTVAMEGREVATVAASVLIFSLASSISVAKHHWASHHS